jgi:hypothetical protein
LSSRLFSKNLKTKVNKSIILLVVLYGFHTSNLILREEYGLIVFKDRVLRRIFGPKREEVAKDWRRLHSEELHSLYTS